MADTDDLHRQFMVQAAASAVEAIDDEVLASSRRRLPQSGKDEIFRLLETGFTQVLQEKQLGDWGDVTALAVWGRLLDLEKSETPDRGEALHNEITKEVHRAFANFAEGLVGLCDDELRRRE